MPPTRRASLHLDRTDQLHGVGHARPRLRERLVLHQFHACVGGAETKRAVLHRDRCHLRDALACRPATRAERGRRASGRAGPCRRPARAPDRSRPRAVRPPPRPSPATHNAFGSSLFLCGLRASRPSSASSRAVTTMNRCIVGTGHGSSRADLATPPCDEAGRGRRTVPLPAGIDPLDYSDAARTGNRRSNGAMHGKHVRARTASRHSLTLVVGGNNAVTRPACLGSAVVLIGLITLDAHFDMRDLDSGLEQRQSGSRADRDGFGRENSAGRARTSPIRAPMHATRSRPPLHGHHGRRPHATGSSRGRPGARPCRHCDTLLDCDIDVIDRSQLPGAPGARPGGISVEDFFGAVRSSRGTRGCG